MIFHPSITQHQHERNIRRYNLARRRWQEGQDDEFAEVAQPVLSPLAEVPQSELQWLWPGRVPLQQLTLFVGESGAGKSLVAADLAARATSARGWPGADGPAAPPGDVLFLASHIDWEHLLRPRLTAAQADIGRITLFSDVIDDGPGYGEPSRGRFDLRTGLKLLENLLDDLPEPRLLVVDPFSEFVSFDALAGYEFVELQRLLGRLRKIANARGMAVVCTETFPSGVLFDRPKRGRRAPSLVDSAFQTVWGVARGPRASGERLFLPVRHYLGDERDGLRFTIERAENRAPIVAWGNPQSATTFEEASIVTRPGGHAVTNTERAKVWLRGYLADGAKPSADVFRKANNLGFGERSLRTALQRVADKQKHGMEGGWYWRLKENV
jgi:hypothetical protein